MQRHVGMLLPAACELLANSPTIDAGVLAVIPLLFAVLFTSWFVRGSARLVAR